MRRKLLALTAVLCGFFGVLFCNANAFAVVDDSVVLEKWFLTGFYDQCEGQMTKFFSKESLNTKKTSLIAPELISNGGKIQLPAYSFGGVKSSGTVGCKELLLGTSFKSNSVVGSGLLSLSKLNVYSSTRWGDSGAQDFMTKMGYTQTGDGSEVIQININQDGNATPLGTAIVVKGGKYSTEAGAGENSLLSVDVTNDSIVIINNTGFAAWGGGGCVPAGGEKWKNIVIQIGASVDQTISNIKKTLEPYSGEFICMKSNGSPYGPQAKKIHYDFPKGDAMVTRRSGGGYKFNSIKTAVKGLSGFGKISDIKWTKPERYTIYQYYLNSAASKIVCDPGSDVDTKRMKQVVLKHGDKMDENCYAFFNGNEPNTFPVSFQSEVSGKYKIVGKNSKKSNKTLQDVIDWLNKYAKGITPSEVASIDEVIAEDGSGGSEAEKTCVNQGGAESLGWIVCPILEWLGHASTEAYEKYVEPSLKIDPQLFTKGNEGVRVGWENFRNIANVIFIILLLAVIFSQLTGVGIDNYGIKKILPKLIIAAVLINLSYLMCILVVDLSNILGNGLRLMFEGLPTSGGTPAELVQGLAGVDSIKDTGATSGTLVTVAVLAALVVMVGTIWQNPAILLSLLVAALGVAVSIFFLFVLLAVREAGIIVLVVISPLAVAAYMLPNTKKLFDKWWKLFQGMLLVYPICGLLVGGGNYISKLLISADFAGDGFLKAFTAMIVGIVPIFFIPTVLKSSFSAMGKIGGMITGLGDKAKGGVTGRAQKAGLYKNAQEASLRRKARIQAGIDRKGNEKDLTGIQRLMRGGKRNIATSRAQYLKDEDAKRRADDLTGVGYEAAKIAQEKKAEKDMVDNYMTLINSRTRNGDDEDALFKEYERYRKMGDKNGAVAAARIAGRRKDTADRFMNEYVKNAEVANYKGEEKDAFASVAKEVATGDNSGNFKSASPFSFQFMSDYHANADKEGFEPTNYNDWMTRDNISKSLSNYVTNSQELVGMKGSSLDELNDLISTGRVNSSDVDRIRKLAGETIDNRDKTGVWDSTKEKQLYALAGRELPGSGTASGGATGGAAGGGSTSRPASENDALREAWLEQQGTSSEELTRIQENNRMRDAWREQQGLDVDHDK